MKLKIKTEITPKNLIKLDSYNETWVPTWNSKCNLESNWKSNLSSNPQSNLKTKPKIEAQRVWYGKKTGRDRRGAVVLAKLPHLTATMIEYGGGLNHLIQTKHLQFLQRDIHFREDDNVLEVGYLLDFCKILQLRHFRRWHRRMLWELREEGEENLEFGFVLIGRGWRG